LLSVKNKDICAAGHGSIMNEAYLLTGGNMGKRETNLFRAREYIEKTCGKIIQSSFLYETEAWGKKDQPAFLNQALKIATGLTPQGLLQQLLSIEKKIGRVRKEKYDPRIIDIDILLFGNMVIEEPHLRIPHPELPKRRFALVPLAEIAATFIHPVLRKTIVQLLDECEDPLLVKKI
jgi:2-amino-4-hydroxy-6-hydroxymethyldihydropteridine diphosphokinase